jgi:hypothetical protein
MRTFRTLPIFSLVLLIYYLIGRGMITPFVRWFERRFSRGLVQRRSA